MEKDKDTNVQVITCWAWLHNLLKAVVTSFDYLFIYLICLSFYHVYSVSSLCSTLLKFEWDRQKAKEAKLEKLNKITTRKFKLK